MEYNISILLFCADYEIINITTHYPRKFTRATTIGTHEEKYFHSTCILPQCFLPLIIVKWSAEWFSEYK